jgi:hypothetical protein
MTNTLTGIIASLIFFSGIALISTKELPKKIAPRMYEPIECVIPKKTSIEGEEDYKLLKSPNNNSY